MHLDQNEQDVRVLKKVKKENDGRPGTCEEDLERCISRGRGATRDMFIRDDRRSER